MTMGSHCGPLTLLSITPQSSILADLVEPLDSFVRVNSMLVTNTHTHTHTKKRSFVKGHRTGSNYVGHENLDCFMVFLKRPSVFHQASCKRRCRNQCIPHFLSCEQRSFVVYQGASYCAEEIRSQYAQEATDLKFLQRRREMFCCTHCTLRRALHSSEPIALCPVFHDTYDTYDTYAAPKTCQGGDRTRHMRLRRFRRMSALSFGETSNIGILFS